MPLPFEKEQLEFLEDLKRDPARLHKSEFAVLKTFVEHFGGKIPEADGTSNEIPKAKEETSENRIDEDEDEDDGVESDLELDMSGIIEPDTDSPQPMGDPNAVPTEEEIAESKSKRSEAVSAFVENNYDRAIELYTEAIVSNPQAALLYAKRGQIYLLKNKPNACIRDCDRALELNPDGAAAHKFRGRANRLLGRFEEAATDLRLACKFDFDEEADEWLREVTPNARKIEEHKRKKERKSVEKAQKDRIAASKRAAKGAKTQADDGARASRTDGSTDNNDQNAANNSNYKEDVLNVFQEALKDPEVKEAIYDIMKGPENLLKYKNNPKVMAVLDKASGLLSGNVPGFPGFPGMMGGMPGAAAGLFAGMGGAASNQPKGPKPSAPSPDDDVGLD